MFCVCLFVFCFVFASYKSNSRGVAVILNNNFEFKVRAVQRDENGNFIIILLFAMNKELLLVNIYDPNKDNPAFYQSLSETVKRYKNHNVVIVGDWNLVLDSQLDCYNYKHINNPKDQRSGRKYDIRA